MLLFVSSPAFAQTPTVTNTIPRRGSNGVVRTENVVAQFSTNMMGSTITSNRFFCYSGQMGMNRGAISYNSATNQATLNPSRDLFPGEFVNATLTRGITNAAGTLALIPYTWTFAAAALGTGEFVDSGQAFGTNYVDDIALADVDNDGDLDVFVVNFDAAVEVWTNDGSGTLHDSGQRLGSGAGRYVGFGDVDKDGDLDAYVVNWQQPAVLWTNNGSGIFGDSGQVLPGGNGRSVCLADFNGDGWLDALVARQDEASLVLTNDGTGLLTTGQSLAVAASLHAAVGDVDGDGQLDAAFANWNKTNTLYLGNGDGTFTLTGQDLGVGRAREVALGDFDADGDLDLFFAHDNAFGSTVWTNDGTGVFTDSGQLLGTNNCRGVDLGDFDGDGDLDAFTCNYDQPNQLWTNDGHAVFGDSGQELSTNASWHAAAGDVNGDGALDVVVGNQNTTCELWFNAMPGMSFLGTNGQAVLSDEEPSLVKGTDFGEVWRQTRATNWFAITNSGSHALTISGVTVGGESPNRFIVEAWPSVVDVGAASNCAIVFDPTVAGALSATVVFANNSAENPYNVKVQGYGWPVWVTNTVPSNGAVAVAPNATLTAQFSTNMDMSVMTSNRFLTHSGQSGFGYGVITINSPTEAVMTPTAPFRAGERVFACVTLGITNAAGTTEITPKLWSFYAAVNARSGTFSLHQSPSNITDARDVALGDLDNDGDLDALIVRNGQPGQIWTNDGSGTFYDSGQTLGTTPASRAVALADTDGDGDLDAGIVNYGGGCRLWTNNGTGTFADRGAEFGFVDGLAGAFGDIDGDGDQDFVRGTAITSYSHVYRNNGDNTFSVRSTMQLGGDRNGTEFGDLDGDGDLDLYIVDSGSLPDRVWLNNGSGKFSDGGTITNRNATAVALGDLDGDGDIDAFVTRSSGGNLVRINNGAAVFTDSGQRLGSAKSRKVALGDVDGDGDLDAFVANSGSANVVWTNDGSGVFGDSGQSMGSGASVSVALGDLDGDGDLDAFVVNSKQNHEVWMNGTVVQLTGQAGPNGTITPSGSVYVVQGGSTSFVMAADTYYWIGELLTNGAPDAAAAQARAYTSWWIGVMADGTASVSFTEALAPLGTPEWWLAQYGLTNGGATFDQAETNNPDSDPFTSGDEYICDTDPTNGASYFHIGSISNLSPVTVYFESSSNRWYTMNGCSNLMSSAWTNVTGAGPRQGVGGTDSMQDTNAPAGRLFYRMQVELP